MAKRVAVLVLGVLASGARPCSAQVSCRFVDAPGTHDHLESITFALLPKSRWGTRRDCEYQGQMHVCPVYLSTQAMPHLSQSVHSYISLWHDPQGAWVMTWAISRNGNAGPPSRTIAEKRATDQANFKPPYGTHAASGNTREIDVSKAPGWPGGAKFCCDSACNSIPIPTPPPPPKPTPPPTTPAPTTTITTTTKTTWEGVTFTRTTTLVGNTATQVRVLGPQHQARHYFALFFFRFLRFMAGSLVFFARRGLCHPRDIRATSQRTHCNPETPGRLSCDLCIFAGAAPSAFSDTPYTFASFRAGS